MFEISCVPWSWTGEQPQNSLFLISCLLHGLLVNLGRQVIKWRIEILIEGSSEDEIDALISESFKESIRRLFGCVLRDGDEVASMPCDHVYHYNSVVLISNAIE
ncbi:hypothetical protein V6N13_035535 [Hibiscus sabdariffa]|uniref:Uncharacterized protein n=1 Tax=Hibiscus sabdariffa TaxID=183260 RepID=A0ABR2S941_9ROSI